MQGKYESSQFKRLKLHFMLSGIYILSIIAQCILLSINNKMKT